MFENVIEFSTSEEYLKILDETTKPRPVKLNIPPWFKNLQHSNESQTVKGCVPFLDTLITGYSLLMPQDVKFQWGYDEEQKAYYEKRQYAYSDTFFKNNSINLNSVGSREGENHGTHQFKNSHVHDHTNLPANKIINPWVIKTPPGYSCLFVSPLNNPTKGFSIISGIVDTDNYPNYINFPIWIDRKNNDKNELEIKKGTPYVQVIPFKRDNWKMKFGKLQKDEDKFFLWKISNLIIHRYKNKVWKKKIFK